MARHPIIRLVCFDLGGVLIRICRSWEEGCVTAGLELRTVAGRPAASAGWFAPRDVTDFYQLGRISCDEFARRLSAAFEHQYSPQEIMAVHHAWLLGEYPDVGDVIDAIHQTGLATAALSNTNHSHWMRMNEFPAVMRLQHRLASHELGLHKPDPAIYRAAQETFGCAGEEILFFDDLEENVEAAQSVGWNARLIDHKGDTADQIASALESVGVLSRERL